MLDIDNPNKNDNDYYCDDIEKKKRERAVFK